MTVEKVCVAGGALLRQTASREHLLVTVRETEDLGKQRVRT